jgi:hypothetical protein
MGGAVAAAIEGGFLFYLRREGGLQYLEGMDAGAGTHSAL